MNRSENEWVPVAICSAGYEADLMIARLDAEGILAVRRGNDIVGLFGPGFEGSTARGITVLVPRTLLDEAREVLETDPETNAGTDAE